jgi:hypothetical protein
MTRNGPGYVASVAPDSYESHCQAHPEMWAGRKTTRFESAQGEANVHNDNEHSPLPHSELEMPA